MYVCTYVRMYSPWSHTVAQGAGPSNILRGRAARLDVMRFTDSFVPELDQNFSYHVQDVQRKHRNFTV